MIIYNKLIILDKVIKRKGKVKEEGER